MPFFLGVRMCCQDSVFPPAACAFHAPSGLMLTSHFPDADLMTTRDPSGTSHATLPA
jgi:hypothetical protein